MKKVIIKIDSSKFKLTKEIYQTLSKESKDFITQIDYISNYLTDPYYISDKVYMILRKDQNWRFNPETYSFELMYETQTFNDAFYNSLVLGIELGAIERVEGLSGCYAKGLSSPLTKDILVYEDDKEICKIITLSKPSVDEKTHLYTFREQDMTFAEFMALEGTLYSNKLNGLSKLENYQPIEIVE